MTRGAIFLAVTAISTVALAGSLSARPALKDVAHVRDGIIAVGIAYEISQKCSDLRPRYLRGLNFLESLKDHARGLGYSDVEISAYVDDKSEKNRLEAIARSQLAEMGAVVGQEATYCSVGRNEIAAQTSIGRLLR